MVYYICLLNLSLCIPVKQKGKVWGSQTRTDHVLCTIIYHTLGEIIEIMVVQIWIESIHTESLCFPHL